MASHVPFSVGARVKVHSLFATCDALEPRQSSARSVSHSARTFPGPLSQGELTIGTLVGSFTTLQRCRRAHPWHRNGAAGGRV